VTPVRIAYALPIGVVLPLTPDKKATMIKKLITLTIASASTLALTGCGATEAPVLDTSIMGDGTPSRTAFGGYWWTHVDRGVVSRIVPNTGKVTPTDAWSTRLNPSMSVGQDKGIEDDGTGNLAYHVHGDVDIEPNYPPDKAFRDRYWDQLYSELCANNVCDEYVYPSSGVGFGFKAKNVPLGTDAIGTKGITFRIKIGPRHAKYTVTATDGSTTTKPRPITIEAPMDYTDCPDPSFNDEYGTHFVANNPNAQSLLWPAQPAPGQPGDRNLPLCLLQGTVLPDGTVTNNTKKTCFAHPITGTGQTAPLEISEQWVTYCAAWTDFNPVTWTDGLKSTPVPQGGITALYPDHLIKIQFEAYKPPTSDRVPMAFDYWLDDVVLLTDATWATSCNPDKGVKLIQQPTL
jgi:hypothetical protein